MARRRPLGDSLVDETLLGFSDDTYDMPPLPTDKNMVKGPVEQPGSYDDVSSTFDTPRNTTLPVDATTPTPTTTSPPPTPTAPSSTPYTGFTGNHDYSAFNTGRTQDPGRSAKDAFAMITNSAPPPPFHDRNAFRSWLNTYVVPGMNALGHRVISVDDNGFTYSNHEGTFYVDAAQNLGAPSGSMLQRLQWNATPADEETRRRYATSGGGGGGGGTGTTSRPSGSINFSGPGSPGVFNGPVQQVGQDPFSTLITNSLADFIMRGGRTPFGAGLEGVLMNLIGSGGRSTRSASASTSRTSSPVRRGSPLNPAETGTPRTPVNATLNPASAGVSAGAPVSMLTENPPWLGLGAGGPNGEGPVRDSRMSRDVTDPLATPDEASVETDDPSMFMRDERTPRLDDIDWVENDMNPPIDDPIDREFIGRDGEASEEYPIDFSRDSRITGDVTDPLATPSAASGAMVPGLGDNNDAQDWVENNDTPDLSDDDDPWSVIYDSMFGDGEDDTSLRRFESARELMAKGERTAMNDARGMLALRGLLSEPGSANRSGAESSTIGRVATRNAEEFARALRDIGIAEDDNANTRLMHALSLATGMSQSQAQTYLAALGSATDRQNMLAQIALESLSQNMSWNMFLAQFGLERDKAMYMIQNGQIDQIMPYLAMFLQLAQSTQRGYV